MGNPTGITLALDLEGVLITNAVSQFPRPGLREFLEECEKLLGKEHICIFTTVPESLFRQIANTLVAEKLVPGWFSQIRYIDWVGEHKDLRFVDNDIESVIIVDDYPPYIKPSQKHRLIDIPQYLVSYTDELPDVDDCELEIVLKKLRLILA
jgi:NLI interacting factor-like phosphatase